MSTEIVTGINEVDDGYDIATTRQVIRLRMDTDTSCCESPGYFLSEEDASGFIGSELLSVRVVDEALASVEVPDVYEGGVMFVNVETSRGLLQFVAHNQQNGYYGHTASVACEQVTHSEYL